MNPGVVLCAAGLLAAWSTLTALVRLRHPAWLTLPTMMASWLVGEAALIHLTVQAALTAVLVGSGALGSMPGRVGLAAMAVSAVGLVTVARRSRRAAPTAVEPLSGMGIRATAAELVAAGPPVRWWRPGLGSLDGVRVVRDIAYGDHPRQRLDLHVPDGHPPPAGRPVVLQIHGGGWVIGDKRQQGQPLLRHLARHGVVGVAMNYRLAPRHRLPDQIVDVKRVIAWIRHHIDGHGGDAERLVVTGGSAGGHLAALAALTADDPRWQPGFADVDCSVRACIPFYPPTDLTDRLALRGRTASMEPFLRRWVMPEGTPPGRAPATDDPWQLLSPIARVRPDAPPFFVIQGDLDVLVWREETRAFVDALAAVSAAPVALWEVPGAQHAFDVFTSHRCSVAVAVVTAVVDAVVGTSGPPSLPGTATAP